ncbi:hypothetical protein L6164_027319 [Bauhinia variegata]|uniref:Uncharacterized protein n=1 Tax=Bauhinia variegata TaxID=167791 RepID=A0ACB9LT52_BAUVA|nr:hypothetical protein L6164_027319 [Bauhinia variegata]
MAESSDRSTSSLLCSENSNTCFGDLECNAADYPSSCNQGSELFMGFPVLSEESVCVMTEREREHLARDDYLKRLRSGELDLSVRKYVIDWIWKAHAYYGFGPLCLCLSINYLDRFLSIYELPRGNGWTVQLLAVACLSIAAKMEETRVPQSVDLQVGEPKFLFEAKTIQRMELLVLNTLRWRMLALTPCSFIDFFLRKINNGQHPSESSISRSIQLILSTIRGVDFLEFRPSEIAAAVAISVSGEMQAFKIEKGISCFMIVEKERVLKCLELVRGLSEGCVSSKVGSNTMPLVPQSPLGVLDTACLSYKSDELTVGSCPNSPHNCPITKRNKSERPSDMTSKSLSVNFPPSPKLN